MNYQQQMIQPLPPPVGSDEIDLQLWAERPDLWGDCTRIRSQKKYWRINRKQQILKELANEQAAKQTEGIFLSDEGA